ncbi:hypothetical protein [Corynebacterium propinquum]
MGTHNASLTKILVSFGRKKYREDDPLGIGNAECSVLPLLRSLLYRGGNKLDRIAIVDGRRVLGGGFLGCGISWQQGRRRMALVRQGAL